MADLREDVELTKRVCELLGTIDDWVWPSTSTADVGVFYGRIGDSPSRAVGARVYMTSDERDDVAWRRLQLRFRGERGDPTGADRLADRAFVRLHRLSRLGGISGISRLSMAPSGADENGREERTDNYLIILDNPEASS